MNSKPRPENAAGPNGLRGGIKNYSNKTILGSWLDEVGGPAKFKRGFSTSDYETEAQYAQKGVYGNKNSNYFGAEIQDELEIGKENESNDDNWLTSSKLMNLDAFNKSKEPSSSIKLDRSFVEEYRRKWTTDPSDKQLTRFQTETRASSSFLSKKFYKSNIRILPGSPKPLENLRNKLNEKYGIFGYAALRSYIYQGEQPIQEFKQSINKINLGLKPFELNQIIAYLTPSTTTINGTAFLKAIRGNIPGFKSSLVNNYFKAICGNEEDKCPIERANYFIRSDKHPEVDEFFGEFICNYSKDGLNLSTKEFLDFHDDLYAFSILEIEEILENIWNLEK